MAVWSRLIVAVGLTLSFLGVACTAPEPSPISKPSTPTPTPLPGTLYTVARGDVAQTLKVRGSLDSMRRQILSFDQGGWIKRVNIAAGDQVKEGDTLVELDIPGLEDQVLDAEYDERKKALELAQAEEVAAEVRSLNLNKARIQEQIADLHVALEPTELGRRDWELQKRIFELETRIAQQETRRAELQAKIAKVDLERATDLLARREKRLETTRLKAPFDGLIVGLEKIAGERVEPFEVVAVVADPQELKIDANALEININEIALQQRAIVTLDVFPTSRYRAYVAQISSEPIIWQGKKAYRATLRFEEGQLIPAAIGMGADVQLTTSERQEVLVVPSAAIYTNGEEKLVEVVQGGRLRRVPVTLGLANATRTEIVTGLQEGDIVLVP